MRQSTKQESASGHRQRQQLSAAILLHDGVSALSLHQRGQLRRNLADRMPQRRRDAAGYGTRDARRHEEGTGPRAGSGQGRRPSN